MPPSLTPRRLPVFLCYAHQDNDSPDPSKRWLDRLRKHLAPLKDQIGAWSDREIEAGTDWHEAIRQSLQAARAAVLLVSPDFLDSNYIRSSELPALIRRARDEGLPVLPLILRPCLFEESLFRYPDPVHGPEEFSLASFQAVNPPDRPLSKLAEYEQDEVLVSLAQRLLREVRRPAAGPAPPVEPPPQPRLPVPGERVGKYRVDRLLGQGGMGVVYAATHDELGPVAIKMLHPHLSADPALAARFLNEARAAAGLHDPGIVRVHDCGQLPGGAAYLVMEYLWGESLAARLSRAPGPRPEVLPLLQQVAAVLSVVHRRGVVHRDLKPDNVMVIPDAAMPGGERVKLLDFGIAKLAVEQAGSVALRGPTRTGAMMGTPFYMAPEQCQDASRVTDRADVYSLGVMLYQVLSGGLPFAADSLPALIGIYLRREQPVPLRSLGVAPVLSALVAEMLGYDAAKRPSMAQVRERIEQALRESASQGLAARPSKRAEKRPPRPKDPPVQRVATLALDDVEGQGPGKFGQSWRVGGVVLGAVALLSGVGVAIRQCGKDGPVAAADMRLPQSGPATSPNISVQPPDLAKPIALRPQMARIEAGTFMMGSPKSEAGRDADEVSHQVKISRPFLISVTEVTQGQYQAVTSKNPSSFKGSLDLPVEQVSWFDAVRYCNQLSEKEGLSACYRINGEDVTWPDGLTCTGYRLPTEAEWEYAARAGQDTRYAGSSELDKVAWYDGNKTHSVGQKQANAWGLHDMTGNVWEWVWDLYKDDYYKQSRKMDPIGPDSGSYRVDRGGSWGYGPFDLRVANRNWARPDDAYDLLGFRLSRSLP